MNLIKNLLYFKYWIFQVDFISSTQHHFICLYIVFGCTGIYWNYSCPLWKQKAWIYFISCATLFDVCHRSGTSCYINCCSKIFLFGCMWTKSKLSYNNNVRWWSYHQKWIKPCSTCFECWYCKNIWMKCSK